MLDFASGLGQKHCIEIEEPSVFLHMTEYVLFSGSILNET
jgi:hypothetical protein